MTIINTTTESLRSRSSQLRQQGLRLMDEGEVELGSTLVERADWAERALANGHPDTAEQMVEEQPRPQLDRYMLAFFRDAGMSASIHRLVQLHYKAVEDWAASNA